MFGKRFHNGMTFTNERNLVPVKQNMRTQTSKAWPLTPTNEAVVEPKSVQDVLEREPLKALQNESDVIYTVHIKREHIIIALLSLAIVFLCIRLSFVSGRLALLESSYTTRMK